MSTEICGTCEEIVDPIDLLSAGGFLYHTTCFKCSQCNKKLSIRNYSSLDGILYCKSHGEQKVHKNGRVLRRLSLPKAFGLRKTSSRLSSIFSRTHRNQAVPKKTVYPLEKRQVPEDNNGGGASTADAPETISDPEDNNGVGADSEPDDNGDGDFTADSPTVSTNQIFTSATDQSDPATIMNQLMQNPDLDALLAGVSNQTGFESPDFFRNMLYQVIQNPEMMNVINQLGQQMDGNQDLGSMFASMNGSQSGGVDGLDLSITIQQMMPYVSQALSRRGSTPNLFEQVPSVERKLSRRCYSDSASLGEFSMDCQMNLLEVVQKIEDEYPPLEVFASLVETAALLHDNIHDTYGLAELCSDEDLAQEFMLMLKHDISRRLGKRL